MTVMPLSQKVSNFFLSSINEVAVSLSKIGEMNRLPPRGKLALSNISRVEVEIKTIIGSTLYVKIALRTKIPSTVMKGNNAASIANARPGCPRDFSRSAHIKLNDADAPNRRAKKYPLSRYCSSPPFGREYNRKAIAIGIDEVMSPIAFMPLNSTSPFLV